VEIPTLRTQRLSLCPPSVADFQAYVDFYADAAASSFYGGPLNREQAWRRLASDIGHWSLRGFGIWSLREIGRDAIVGGCGIVWPEGWPRHELTWWIAPAARRRGFALEASEAAIRWAYDELGWTSVETHMKDDNAAARALAERLGGQITAREQFPDGLARDIYSLPRP